jgi:hypothetical protein
VEEGCQIIFHEIVLGAQVRYYFQKGRPGTRLLNRQKCTMGEFLDSGNVFFGEIVFRRMGRTFAENHNDIGFKNLSIYRNPSVSRSRTKSNLLVFLLPGLYTYARFLPTNIHPLF